MKVLRVFGFIVVFLLSLEILFRFSGSVLPQEAWQRYEFDDYPAGPEIGNGLGAIGRDYKGQAFRIGIFGTSPNMMPDVQLDKKWSGILSKKLGRENVHIDNYAIAHTYAASVIEQMKAILKRGIQYDLVLVGVVFHRRPGSLFDQRHFHFSKRWLSSGNGPLVFPEMLGRYFDRRKNAEAYLEKLFGQKNNSIERQMGKVFSGEVVYGRSLRQHDEIKARLRDSPLPKASKEQLENFHKQVIEIKELAAKISKKLVWTPVRTAFSEDMLSSYFQIYEMVLPVRSFDKNNPRFHSPKALHKRFQWRNELTLKIVKSEGIGVWDWSAHVNQFLSQKPFLYKDEFHLSDKGAEIVADYLMPKIEPLVAAKMQSK